MKYQLEENRILATDEHGAELGELNFTQNGDEWIITHVGVSVAARRKGLGGALVEKAVQYAKDRHKKITPLCSFAVSEFANNPSYKNVLAE
nr:GNAT family N-acetyltransferase [Eubacterium sp. 1001713B170207_170306_E7]